MISPGERWRERLSLFLATTNGGDHVNNPKLAALGAFLAGGVLIGGITLGTSVAHGASTASTSTASAGQSAAQYTAKHAWVQAVPASQTALSIPVGDRLTLTSAIKPGAGNDEACSISTTVNGASAAYTVWAFNDGANSASNAAPTPFQPVYTDTGTINCPSPVTLVGYLTPIPAGSSS